VTPKPNDAWEFWQRSKKALDELNDLMQVMGTAVAQDDPTLQVPHQVIKDVKRNLQRFQESFSCLVHAQKRKAAR
jgi:hypothetical protein